MKVLNALTKHLVLYSVFLFSNSLASENSSLLSSLKQQQLDLDRQINELQTDVMRFDWINPIMGAWSYNYSNLPYPSEDIGTWSVSVDQPIFKSGGIYFSIQYANASKDYLRLVDKLNEQVLIKSAIGYILQLNKIDMQIQRQKLIIENANIDVITKKEQFENGFIDSSTLDRAIIDRNTFRHVLIDLNVEKNRLLNSFKSISDANYEDIIPPYFALVDLDEYLRKSLEILKQSSQIQKDRYLKNSVISSYLPTISLSGAYYSKRYDNGLRTANDDYQTYGIKVSMPLFDANRARNIEQKQLEYLRSSIKLEDVKRSEEFTYETLSKQIEFLKQKVDISKSDLEFYSSLLESTKTLFDAGERTKYDIEVLRNSKEVMYLASKMYEIDIQLALLELYANMNGKI